MVYLFLTPLQQNSGLHIPFPQPEHLKSRVPFFFPKIGNSTFQWFTSSWPRYSKTPATTSHSHSLNTSKVESLFFPKNWQLYFSVVYLFLTPLQQNSGHYIPFPQPENLKSRVPFFFRKIGNSTFQWFTSSWPLYSKTPATTSHSHSLKTSKIDSLFFPKNWQLYFSVVYLFLTPVQHNSGHHIPFRRPENLKSRVPFFSEKLATLLFSGLPFQCPQLVHRPSTRSRHSLSLLRL